jgi:putative aminopeptidase FrvX
MTGATAVALTSGLSINAEAAVIPLQFTFLTTTTDAERTLTQGDSVRVSIVTVGSVTVQPDDVTVAVELLVME